MKLRANGSKFINQKTKTMNIFKIRTTSFIEDDFYLLTDLNWATIESVISRMVAIERAEDSEVYYTNDDYVDELTRLFPDKNITHYTEIPLIEL